MQAVAVAGQKKSGKTALLALIAETLEKEGKQVAIIKYSSHPVERDNTDAFWLMRPNRVVASVSVEETAIFWPDQLDFKKLSSMLSADVLLMEGGDAPVEIPRILCFREDEPLESVKAELGGFPVLASLGAPVPGTEIPFFSEIDPQTAENIVKLIKAKGFTL